ncbi:hypothetical protein M3568_14235 [Priestia flexa]|uniref:hypothetical protein n=1 Tax=Priestia flexa TaxID=86664 RepID=UPI002040F652|nr:hypothetical protein [Priestia flexa]MCM3067546.1 hypothetical protein [Priestia flexa]
MNSKKFIRLVKNGRQLLRMKVKETPIRYNTNKGEVDILIDSAKNKCFDVACLQTEKGRIYCEKPINSASWHGFYDERENPIKLPVLHFKHNHEKVFSSRHRGIIQQENIFLFPICSLYLPKDIDVTNLSKIEVSANDHFIEIKDNSSNVRVDFFILPKGVSFEKFVSNISLSFIYFVSDISIFNKHLNGEFRALPVEKSEGIEFQNVQVGEWDMLIRLLYTEKTNEPDLCGKYSLLFHDPNDAIEMLLDRNIVYPKNDGQVTYDTMRDKYNNEVNNLKT